MANETIQETLTKLRKLPIVKDALERLKAGLPSDLLYHAYEHTEDVLAEAILFAMTDKLPEREVELLAIAAAYHDLGFIKSPIRNEPIGAKEATEAMRADGTYTESEVATVAQMILDTMLVETPAGPRQIPSTDLSRYLLDADLSNLGRDDFFDKGELQRRELGYDQEIFRKNSFSLLNTHRWLTNAARSLRQKKKEENVKLLKQMLSQESLPHPIDFDRLGFLARLPLLLNSSLNTHEVVKNALAELKKRLEAEAATIFMLDGEANTLSFWAIHGADNTSLEGSKMPADRGVVGWVISHKEGALVTDAQRDERFFPEIDRETNFVTRNMVCAPLIVRGSDVVGAIQVLNRIGGDFKNEDLVFLTQFSHQAALALENARLYEELQTRNKQLELLDSRKNEMMAVIAHEFRTPLNLIGSSADLLASGALNNSEMVDKMCSVLTSGVQRLTKLIAEIRNLSLSSNACLVIQKAPITVDKLLNEVNEAFKAGASGRRISLLVECATEDLAINGDFALLAIALNNLASNAIRFTPDGGCVTLKAIKSSGLVQIEVQDTGIGINATQIPLIFEKFYEVQSSLNHSSGNLEFKSGGLGLGLATVKAILKAHGTTCHVQSIPGTGSTFSFTLPAV